MWILACCFLATGRLGEALQARVESPIGFSLRQQLNREPAVSSRLVAFGFDDATLSYLGAEDLNLDEWQKVFEALAAKQPKAILIDKIFGSPSPLTYGPTFVSRIQGLNTPIVTASFVTSDPISFRTPLSWLKAWPSSPLNPSGTLSNDKGPYLYGAHPQVAAAFKNYGHSEYGEYGRIMPVKFRPMQKGPGGLMSLHWSLYAGNSLAVNNNEVVVDNTTIPTDREGLAWVNSLSDAAIRKKTYKLQHVIQDARLGRPIRVVNPGDVVIVLSNLFIGGGHNLVDAFGTRPAGYSLLSIANSAMTGAWLWPCPPSIVIVIAVALGVLGFSLPWLVGPYQAQALAFGLSLSVGLVGLAGFIFYGLIIPWIGLALCPIGCGGLAAIYRLAIMSLRSRDLHRALAGIIPKEQVQAVIENPKLLDIAPQEKIVSILFIDIVGFSVRSDKLPPKQAFDELRDLMRGMTDLIHHYGGWVDKSLGDGLLCCFGFDMTRRLFMQRHADEALKCAIAIQDYSLQRILQAENHGQIPFALRIGINTASVYIGDLGDKHRFDLTMIGSGVNFASRLETSCAPFKILISVDTKRHLSDEFIRSIHLNKRLIKVKHVPTLVETFECNPFTSDPQRLYRGGRVLHGNEYERRQSRRIPIPKDVSIIVHSEHGALRLVDCSESGISTFGEHYFAKGVHLRVDSISHQESDLAHRLLSHRITPFDAEVRWGDPQEDGGFLHGLALTGLPHAQRQMLFQALSEWTQPNLQNVI